MNLNELTTTMAILEERGKLDKLDEIGLPAGNALQWVFGPTSGFYFTDGEAHQIRQSKLGSAVRVSERLSFSLALKQGMCVRAI
ncbi:hypothetical protein AGRHK599_LOCUS4897 [Rhizobium rhizogenes]|uniref:Uncharacterized protein n=1 Tax=Rhizobium rhizogenes TaxID=359 RepID=A0AAN2DG10_RHIRH|nr:hypothetical protein AGRHK599_LOCUS4897 [Rhizobium rhizogenes]